MTTIARGIRTLRRDSRLLDQLFRNLDQRSAAEMRTFIKEQSIDSCLNYPREALKIPAIIILLKAEEENTAYLGDSKGTGLAPEPFEYDGAISEPPIEVLGGTASVSTMSGLGKLVFAAYKAMSGTNNTLKIGSEQWPTSKFVGHTIRLIAGTGAGQDREISANSDDTVMVTPNWVTVPDDTTIFDIRKSEPDEVVGEPSSLYDTHQSTVYERKGSLYGLSYQIQVIGPNPELTIYLAAILKAIFTLSRQFLEQQGIINMKLSATDFVPRTEYQPDFAYMRAIGVDFFHPFDIFEELGGLAQTLQIGIETNPPGLVDASFTSFSLVPDPIVQSDSVDFIAAASAVNADDGSAVVVTRPTTTLLGDFMLSARVRFQSGTAEQAPPAGWTKVSVQQSSIGPIGAITDSLILEVFQRFVQDSEPATYSWDVIEGGIVAMSVYRNVDRQNPVVSKGAYGAPSLAASTTVNAPSVAALPGSMLVASFATNQTGSVSPNPFTVAGMSQRAEQLFSTTTAVGMFDELFEEARQSGVRTATIPVGGGQLFGHMMSLRPVQSQIVVI